jgi:hypothetical protein
MIDLTVRFDLNNLMGELSDLMDELKRTIMIDGTLVEHYVYNITDSKSNRGRDRRVKKIPYADAAVNALFVIKSQDPLNTKETVKHPGYLSLSPEHFDGLEIRSIIDSINKKKIEIKDFLVPHSKSTRISSDDKGSIVTSNPVLFECHRMVNACQLYRKIEVIDAVIAKTSFGWSSSKRYLTVPLDKAKNNALGVKIAAPPIDVELLSWTRDVDFALNKLGSEYSEISLKQITQTPVVAKLSIRNVGKKTWDKHYIPHPVIIVNRGERESCIKLLDDYEYDEKKISQPEENGWKVYSKVLNLYKDKPKKVRSTSPVKPTPNFCDVPDF